MYNVPFSARFQFNSFAATFLTKLFFQCHIYFNHKGHVAMCSSKPPLNLNFSNFIFHNLSRNIQNLNYRNQKYFGHCRICKERHFKEDEG